MKIYREVRINMSTGETEYEDSYEYAGPVAMCGGGGGSSGEVKFPSYQQDQHTTWLSLMDTIIDSEIASNSPYNSATAYDPSTQITLNTAALSAHETLLSALSPTPDWKSAVDAVVSKLQDVIPDTSTIATAVDRRDIRMAPAHFRAIGRVAAAFGDMNATNSSAFFSRLAMLEVEHTRQLDEFESQLELQQESARLQLIATGIQLILGNKYQKAQLYQGYTDMYTRTQGQHIVANVDEVNTNMEWSVRDRKWDVEMLQYAGNLLGSIQGGSMVPDRPTAGQSALSGALSGASIGASFGPIGAGVGAAVGGLASLLF